MRVERRRYAGLSFGMFVFTCAWLVALATLLGVPEIYGISFGWNWRFMDNGQHVVHALTPKITSRGSRVFLVEGEELVVDYDYRPERGRAVLSVYSYGWIPFREETPERLHTLPDIGTETNGELRVDARETRFYVISSDLDKAEGEFAVDWQVEDGALTGRLARLLIIVTSRPLFNILLIAAAIAFVLLRRAWKG
ncbi:MAG: hypothetical protein ACREMK_14770 [Gemmatimonadota bacterium]